MVVEARSWGLQGLAPAGSGAIRATLVPSPDTVRTARWPATRAVLAGSPEVCWVTRTTVASPRNVVVASIDQSPSAGTPMLANSSEPVSASTTVAPDGEPRTSSSWAAGTAVTAAGAAGPRAWARGTSCEPVEQAATATANPATSTTDLARMPASLAPGTVTGRPPLLPPQPAIGSLRRVSIWGRGGPGSTDSRGSSRALAPYGESRRKGATAATKGGRHGRQRRGADASEEGNDAFPARTDRAVGDDHRGRRDGGAGGSVDRPVGHPGPAGRDRRSGVGGGGQLGRVHGPA